jgi:hypothetical protein
MRPSSCHPAACLPCPSLPHTNAGTLVHVMHGKCGVRPAVVLALTDMLNGTNGGTVPALGVKGGSGGCW